MISGQRLKWVWGANAKKIPKSQIVLKKIFTYNRKLWLKDENFVSLIRNFDPIGVENPSIYGTSKMNSRYIYRTYYAYAQIVDFEGKTKFKFEPSSVIKNLYTQNSECRITFLSYKDGLYRLHGFYMEGDFFYCLNQGKFRDATFLILKVK